MKISFLAPLMRKLGYVPARMPMQRSFNGASTSRLTADWRSNGISIDSILAGDLDKLRARSRDLAEDNEYFQKFLTMLKCNVIGESGMTLKNKAAEPLTFSNGEIKPGPLDKLANKLIEDDFWEWGKKENCTVSKDMSWLDVQNLAVEEFGTAGETLWQFVYGDEADNKYGFALKPIEIDRLLTSQHFNAPNGGRIRMGVEKDRNGRVLRYWLTEADPTDFLNTVGNSYSAVSHDAKDFVHLFLRRRIGQSRGYPWASAALMRMKMLAGYEEAVVDGARASACKMGFIVNTGDGVTQYSGEDAPGGGKFMDAEPGHLEELALGKDVKVVDWGQPGEQYDPFVKACIRGMACGLNVSYPNLANDYASVNFSSGRMARMEETEFWKLIQAHVIEHFHKPIFSKWLEQALINQAITYPGSGRALPLSLRRKFDAPNFHGRRWGWVDPTKEVAAKSEELRLKITSHTRICAELGIDRDELFAEIADDKAAAEQHGITLPDEAEIAAAALATQPEVDASLDRKVAPTGIRYNENHDPQTGEFTGGGGSANGKEKKEKLSDRIEGTQAEADREVKKTAKAVADVKAKIEATKEKMENAGSKEKAAFASLQGQFQQAAAKTEQLKAQLEASNARIAALKAKLKARTAESQLNIHIEHHGDLVSQLAKENEKLETISDELDALVSSLGNA